MVILSKSGASSGVGFAVPSNVVSNAVQQIIKHGSVIQVGIGILPLDAQAANVIHVPGVIILSVQPNTPAAKVGLKGIAQDILGRLVVGDIIVGVNEQRITSAHQLFKVFDAVGINKKIRLHIVRNGKHYVVDLKTADVG